MIQTEPVVTRYTADNGQLLAALEQINASQRGLTDTIGKQNASLAAQNKKLNESIAFWGKLNVGIAALPGVIGKVQDVFEEAADLLKMKSAAAGVSIGRLDGALKGQLKTVELYSLAASINSAKVKLNAQQQEVLAGAIRKLGLEGKNVTEVTKDFQKVLATGETNELKKYGIAVQDINGKAKDLAAVFRDDLEPMAAKAAATMETSGETMKRASNDISDALTAAKTAVAELGGEIAAIMSGRSGNNLSSFAGWMVALSGQGGASDVAADVQKEAARIQRLMQLNDARGQFRNRNITAYQDRRAQEAADLAAIEADIIVHDEQPARPRGGGGRRDPNAMTARELAAVINSVDPTKVQAFAAIAVGSRFDGMTGSGTLARPVGTVDAGIPPEAMASIQGVLDASIEANNAIAARPASMLEQMFGPIEEINGYAVALDAVTSAATSAMSAWIDGSMSMGQAVREAIGESLRALALDMTAKAIRHGAEAVGMLAIGHLPEAALHAKAAGMHAAGAVLAGGLARSLGGGGSGGSGASAGGAAPVVTGAGGGSSDATSATIIVGDEFAEDSPRARARKAKRLVAMARERRFN